MSFRGNGKWQFQQHTPFSKTNSSSKTLENIGKLCLRTAAGLIVDSLTATLQEGHPTQMFSKFPSRHCTLPHLSTLNLGQMPRTRRAILSLILGNFATLIHSVQMPNHPDLGQMLECAELSYPSSYIRK